MDLSIIIVSFNTKHYTSQCLKSLFLHLNKKLIFEVVVVDNASQDGSVETFREIARKKDNVHIIESDSNLGFTKANNIGIRKARGRLILLLNSDTYLIDDSILKAIRYVDDHSDVFGCGCTLLNADKTPGVSYGRFPDFFTVLLEIVTARFTRLRAMVPFQCDAVYDIDLPCGAFFLIRKEMLERIGYLDERFFMYCEETDLAKRAWKSGCRIVYFGPTKIVHLRGQSPASMKASSSVQEKTVDIKKVFYQSWRYYLEKHHSRAHAFWVKLLLMAYFEVMHSAFLLQNNKRACLLYKKEENALLSGWQ